LIDIDITGTVNARELNQDLAMIMHQSKANVANKISVDDNIIIPVDNIMLVEELERENKEKDDLLDTKDAIIAEKDEILTKKDEIIDEQAKTISALKKRLGDE
jgi:hypothetical protein